VFIQHKAEKENTADNVVRRAMHGLKRPIVLLLAHLIHPLRGRRIFGVRKLDAGILCDRQKILAGDMYALSRK